MAPRTQRLDIFANIVFGVPIYMMGMKALIKATCLTIIFSVFSCLSVILFPIRGAVGLFSVVNTPGIAIISTTKTYWDLVFFPNQPSLAMQAFSYCGYLLSRIIYKAINAFQRIQFLKLKSVHANIIAYSPVYFNMFCLFFSSRAPPGRRCIWKKS